MKEFFVILRDDFTGEPADVTVQFAWDGVTYEIDLTQAHADELAIVLAPYIEVARRVKPQRKRRKTPPAEAVPEVVTERPPIEATADKALRTSVRDWAADDGLGQAGTGLIRNSIWDAWLDANQCPVHRDRAAVFGGRSG